MTLPLTPDMLHGAYDFLRTTPPFKGWRLPDGDEVEFCVTAAVTPQGKYEKYIGVDEHRISVSSKRIGHTDRLMVVMAHEMVHLHQERAKTTTANAEHNAEFKRLAKQVCRFHGFDPKEF